MISDCHLSAGRIYEGISNVHEDFHFDQEMCDFLEHYGKNTTHHVELFINGDFLDFLNVAIDGEFEELVSEDLAVKKLELIFAGHPEVMDALRFFVAGEHRSIIYLVGNHDADLFFPRVREEICRRWGADAPRIRVIADTDRVRYREVEIHHGNQFEAVHRLDFASPFRGRYLKLPWGSTYVLKIVNHLRWEREIIDKVRPVRAYVLIGMFLDTVFTTKFVFLSMYYFFKSRLETWTHVKSMFEILHQKLDFFQDLETDARRLLDADASIRVIVFGHTHQPVQRFYPDGTQYLNTGTWTQMINLDWRSLGRQFSLSHVYLAFDKDEKLVRSELRQWLGVSNPFRRM